MKLLFASHNKNKVEELRQIFPNTYSLEGLDDLNDSVKIEETGANLIENALLKARLIHEKYGLNIISDDTGLEIEALNGAPGVLSARFAGEENDSLKNMKKVLDLMQNEDNRAAQFRTVIALILNNKEYLFEGIVKGIILRTYRGEGGFGYDPIFLPDGYDQTFAEMPFTLKNKISHRGIAIKNLLHFLNSHHQ
ncbi:MAG TPA: RdgB/HAM1 family non-canonical purine NTP pyrophosphatase [Marinilabiliaceae bacterium]|nr:RdgB/HAM1 family non-canonical purine NTP pyrophosphatase [Marinilabiliaceae bacterium]